MKKILLATAGIIGLSIAGIFFLLSFYDFSNQIHQLTDIVHDRTGRKLLINGKTKLKIGLTPRLVAQDLSFANASWSKVPQMMTAERFEVALDLIALLRKKIIIKQLVLKKSKLLIETNETGLTNYTFTPGIPIKDQAQKQGDHLSAPLPDFLVNALEIEDCQIFFKDSKGEKLPFKITHIRAEAVDFASPVKLDIAAAYGSITASITGSVGALSKIVQKTEIYPFELSGEINRSDLKLKGSLMNLFGEGMPKVKVTVRSSRIMADSFNGPEPDNKKNPGLKMQSDKVFSNQPFDTGFFNQVNLDADIQIAKITAGQFELQNIETQLKIEKTGLILEPFSASVFNGNLEGSLTIRPKKNDLKITSALNIRQLDTQLLVKQLNLEKELKGQLNAAFNLRGQGNSMAGVMAGLNGHAWASMKDGQIEAGFVQSLGGDLLTNALGFLNPFDEKTKLNTLNCAALRLDFIQGIGNIKLMLIDLPEIVASGTGNVDLRKEHLDITVRPSAKEGIGTDGLGKINLSLTNIAKTFKIVGKLNHPKIKIDQSSTTSSIAKTIGGIVLFGPVGIVASLVDAGTVDQNPCPCALAFVRDGNDTSCGRSKKKAPEDETPESGDTGNPFKKILRVFD